MNNQICLRGDESSVSSHFPQVKCDFCDITFFCDLDVSKHLNSSVHVKNVDEFLSMQNLISKDVQKELPKNLTQVFQTLKLRHVKDLKDLADKGFFEIIDEPIAEIAEELATTLVETVVDFETKDFKPRHRAMILSAFSNDKKEESTSSQTQPITKDQAPPVQQIPVQNNPSNVAPGYPKVIPKVEPNVTTNPKPKSSTSRQSTKTVNPQSSTLKEVPKARPNTQENQPRTKSKATRSAASTKSSNTTRAPDNPTNRPEPVRGPTSAMKAAANRNPKSSSNNANSSVRTKPSQAKASGSSNTSSLSAAEKQKNSSSKPVPRLDSTYVPKVAPLPGGAVIKTEPKD